MLLVDDTNVHLETYVVGMMRKSGWIYSVMNVMCGKVIQRRWVVNLIRFMHT